MCRKCSASSTENVRSGAKAWVERGFGVQGKGTAALLPLLPRCRKRDSWGRSQHLDPIGALPYTPMAVVTGPAALVSAGRHPQACGLTICLQTDLPASQLQMDLAGVGGPRVTGLAKIWYSIVRTRACKSTNGRAIFLETQARIVTKQASAPSPSQMSRARGKYLIRVGSWLEQCLLPTCNTP